VNCDTSNYAKLLLLLLLLLMMAMMMIHSESAQRAENVGTE